MHCAVLCYQTVLHAQTQKQTYAYVHPHMHILYIHTCAHACTDYLDMHGWNFFQATGGFQDSDIFQKELKNGFEVHS